jgi:YbbR domain-containing protein
VATQTSSFSVFPLIRRIPSIVGSLFFALLIWFFVAMTKRYTAAVSLPIVLKTENATRTVKGEYPARVEVKLESEGWKILSLYLGQTEWAIDLRNEVQKDVLEIETLAKASQYIKPLPEGMKVLEVEPKVLELELDEKITKHIPIRLATVPIAQPGFVIRPNIQIQPESLTVSGARTVLEPIAFWKAVVPTRREVANDFQFELSLDDTLNGIVTKSVSKVKVRGVAEQLSEIKFLDVNVTLLKSKRPVYVTLIPSRVSLILSGAVSDLAKVRAESLSVIIDGEKLLNDTTGFIAPVVKHPKGLELRRTEPEKIQYILRN